MLLCLFARKSFFQSTVFLYSISFGHPFLNGYGVSQKSTCSHELPIYNVFDRYFYLRCIVISKEHLQPYIWMVSSSFQEAFCNDLVFSRVLPFFETSTFCKGIELIRNSNCSHPFDEQQNKRANATTHSFKFTVFLQNRNCSKEISQLLIMIPPGFRYVHTERSLLFDDVTCGHPFFSMLVSFFQGST